MLPAIPEKRLLLLAAFIVVMDALMVYSNVFTRMAMPFSVAILLDYALVIPWLYAVFGARRGTMATLGMSWSGLMLASSLLLAHGSPLGAVLHPLRQIGFLIADIALFFALLRVWQSWKQASLEVMDTDERFVVALERLVPMKLAARYLATELSVARHAMLSPRIHPLHFKQTPGTAWVLCGFACAGFIEFFPVHMLLEHFRLSALAWVSTGLSLYTSLWLWGLFRAEQGRASSIYGHSLHLRIGLRWQASIPLAQIQSVQLNPHMVAWSAPEHLSTSFELRPNVLLELRQAVRLEGLFGIQKPARMIGLNLAEPERFKSALEDALKPCTAQSQSVHPRA